MKYLISLIILLTACFSVTAEEAPQNLATNEATLQNVVTNEVASQNTATNGVIPEDLLKLADQYGDGTRIFLVKDDDVKVGKKKFFVFNFRTFQDDKNPKPFENYRLRVTVQLTDRRTRTSVFAHHEEDVLKKKASLMRHYEGTEWEFRIPFGEMDKPKLSAYAIEFGFEQDGFFVPLAVNVKGAESADEIVNGEGDKVEIKRTLKNSLWDS